MRISAKAEYACVSMLELAASLPRSESQLVRIKTISDAQGIPPRFLVQILLQLKTAGLVGSVRGASGGYQLHTLAGQDLASPIVVNAVNDRTLTRPPIVPSVMTRSHPPAVETACWTPSGSEIQARGAARRSRKL